MSSYLATDEHRFTQIKKWNIRFQDLCFIRANLWQKNSWMKLFQIPALDFDLAMTLDSGQVFHWEKIDHGFVGAIGDRAVYVEQVGDVLRVGCAETAQPARETRGLPKIIVDYFALDHP